MRALIAMMLLAVVVLLMAWAGWVRFQNRPEGASVTVDKVEIRDDLEEAKHAGERVFDRTGDAMTDPARQPESAPRPAPASPVR